MPRHELRRTRLHRSSLLRRLLCAVVAAIAASSSASAQTIPLPSKTVSLAGPRIGVTSLTQESIDRLKERKGVDVRPLISQFGWQVERQFYSKHSGLTALNEWVLLLGGLEQGVAIPSLSWMVGLRTREGAEIGVGPNITPSGVALAFAAGVTFRAGTINVPMNFALVPSKYGTRVSVLTGFTLRN